MITIKDVAKSAGVSVATVSNALNGQSNVSKKTREHVKQIAEALNYIPNINAKLMKGFDTKNIGLFLPNIHTSFYTVLVQAIYAACAKEGYALMVHISSSYTSNQLTAAILSMNIDGAIILNENLKDEDVALLRCKELPYVFLDKKYHGEKLSSVLINNDMGIAQGVEYLVHLGHKRIAFMRGVDNFDGIERYDHFKEAMDIFGLPIYEEYSMQGFFEINAAYSAIRGLLPRLNTLPDAIFCANDEMAYGTMVALSDIHIKVPEDISIIGFDDGEAASKCKIPLTTIKCPVTEIAARALSELLRLMQSGEEGQEIRISTKLIMRKSCTLRFKELEEKCNNSLLETR